MLNRSIPIILILMFALVACGGGSGSGTGGSGDGSSDAEILDKLSDEEYNALTEEEKFAVSNKALGTLFKGVPADEFFDLSGGVAAAALQSDENYVAKIENDLSTEVNLNQYRNLITQKYEFDSDREAVQYQLALLYEVPLGKTYFEIWMAYQLTNTILFSPATELDSVVYEDARIVFERLLNMIQDGSPIRDIVYEHMISQENWRRFRSPEDNTREMMEIFLKRFIDAEVPLASMACKNWSLKEEDDEYMLVIGPDKNTEPVDILDITVVECTEFYQAVADHADLIPTIVSTLVDIFFAGYFPEDKTPIIDELVAGEPVTFNDIFKNILFSKEYLLNVERPKQFEEVFFALANRIDWFANRNFFKYLNRDSSSSKFPSLNNMKQAAMTYKLGRQRSVPLDTLSFAFYHKAVREKLLIDRKGNPNNNDDGGWQESFIAVDLTGDAFIDYVFLAVASRKASPEELVELSAIITDRGFDRDDRKMQQAMIILDYLSRLSEIYFTQPIEKEV
ncbi:MAG: hypothetical protein PVI71_00040 [Desulfobacterales bacterium]